jgi:hypothetical protein
MPTNTKIIVARYNENIEWTKQFDNVILYNKGDECVENEIKLPNVGREGHTYYTYIYDNYDDLPDYVIFLQGNPFDHSPNIIKDANDLIRNENKPDFIFLGNQLICYLNGCPAHAGLQDTMKIIYEELFGKEIHTNPIKFTSGAQFMVSKKLILKHSRDFYHKIIKFLDYSVNPIEGFVIERFHHLILLDEAVQN